jgi:hypothetical protein
MRAAIAATQHPALPFFPPFFIGGIVDFFMLLSIVDAQDRARRQSISKWNRKARHEIFHVT